MPDDGSDEGSAFSHTSRDDREHGPVFYGCVVRLGSRTDDTLIATASRNDDDGDPVLLTYAWKVDGATKQTTSNVASRSDSFGPVGYGER